MRHPWAHAKSRKEYDVNFTLYFKITTSTFRMSGIYRELHDVEARAMAKRYIDRKRNVCFPGEHEQSAIVLCRFHAPDVKISRRHSWQNQVNFTCLPLDSSLGTQSCARLFGQHHLLIERLRQLSNSQQRRLAAETAQEREEISRRHSWQNQVNFTCLPLDSSLGTQSCARLFGQHHLLIERLRQLSNSQQRRLAAETPQEREERLRQISDSQHTRSRSPQNA